MPALASGQYADRHVFYASYISTYLERDVKSLASTIDSLKFMNFITAVASRTAQMVNYKSIADDCDINQVTAKNWLRILETLGSVFYLHMGREAFLYYYRNKDSKEIDLLMEGDGKLHPIEIKKTTTPEKRLIQTFSIIDK